MSFSVFSNSDSLSLEVTCWNESGVEILNVKAAQITLRSGAGPVIDIYQTPAQPSVRREADYVVVRGTCISKRL